jgi:hypothetical protein
VIGDGRTIKQANFVIYLGCSISTYKINMNQQEINGVIKIHFQEDMRREIHLKEAQCCFETGETWVLRKHTETSPVIEVSSF